MHAKTKPKLEAKEMPLSELKPHPGNSVFPELPPSKLQMLAADIEANGLKHPIEILPDGTILCGHQRVRAAEHLGRQTIRCLVRHDVAKLSPQAQQDYLLQDNLNRRNMTTLEIAKIYIANPQLVGSLTLVEKKKQTPEQVILKLIQERQNCSKKTALRWYRVATAPLPIQHAFERHDLKLDHAASLAILPQNKLKRVADRLRAGNSPAEVAREALRKSGAKRTEPSLESLLKSLAAAWDPIEGTTIEGDEAADVTSKLADIAGRIGRYTEELKRSMNPQKQAAARPTLQPGLGAPNQGLSAANGSTETRRSAPAPEKSPPRKQHTVRASAGV